MDKSKIYKCACGNIYNQIQGLSRHRKTCNEYNNNRNESINKQTNNPMQEQLQILQECLQTQILEKKLLQEQIQKLEFDKVQLQKQVTELQERERNMLIEQVKSLQSQLSCKTTEPSYVEKTNIKCNKKHSVKSYIATCNPITYIPTIEDYSNVIMYQPPPIQFVAQPIEPPSEQLIVEQPQPEIPPYQCNGFVYIIHEREFVKENAPVYKIGRTTKGHSRYTGYPKNSILIFHIECNTSCNIIEKQIINVFKTKYKQRTDIGTEYFEGCKQSMIQDIFNIVRTPDCR